MLRRSLPAMVLAFDAGHGVAPALALLVCIAVPTLAPSGASTRGVALSIGSERATGAVVVVDDDDVLDASVGALPSASTDVAARLARALEPPARRRRSPHLGPHTYRVAPKRDPSC